MGFHFKICLHISSPTTDLVINNENLVIKEIHAFDPFDLLLVCFHPNLFKF